MAKRSRERHELVYRFLPAIGVDPETAAKDTEGIEHHVSPKALEQFERIIERLSQALPRGATDEFAATHPADLRQQLRRCSRTLCFSQV